MRRAYARGAIVGVAARVERDHGLHPRVLATDLERELGRGEAARARAEPTAAAAALEHRKRLRRIALAQIFAERDARLRIAAVAALGRSVAWREHGWRETRQLVDPRLAEARARGFDHPA